MLKYITINVPISPIEANYLVRHNKFPDFKNVPNGKKTTKLSNSGIIELSVWFNWGAMISESLREPTCSLTAFIDCRVIKKNGLGNVLNLINSYMPDVSEDSENLKRLAKLEWKISSATFEYYFTGNQIYTYYKLLRGGYDLTKIKLTKKISKENDDYGNEIYKTKYEAREKEEIEDTEEQDLLILEEKKKVVEKNSNKHVGSVSLEIELKRAKEKMREYEKEIQYVPYKVSNNRLKITIKARKKKIGRICKELNINGRDANAFLDVKDSIDESLFEYYMSHITGSGDFYKCKDAEEIIMKSEFSKKEKTKMLEVLSAVGSYRGISNYLNHVEDAEPRYKSIKSVRKRQYALTVLRNIQNCGINPLVIPVRTETESKKLDNIVTIYKRDCKRNGASFTVRIIENPPPLCNM